MEYMKLFVFVIYWNKLGFKGNRFWFEIMKCFNLNLISLKLVSGLNIEYF